MMIVFLLLTFFAAHAFDIDDLEDFRELIIEEIKSETSGLTLAHPLVGPFDGLAPGNQPLLASLIRLAFHDCSGLNIRKSSSSSSSSSSSDESNPLNKYICDGCIKSTEPDHKGLYEGGINPIEYICQQFNDLSRADCWALAATVAVELAANNTLTSPLRGIFNLNPNTVDILPGDIPYYIGRKDCDTSPDTSSDFEFVPFKVTDGWYKISIDMKNRFGLLNNEEIVALIGGGHSVGRGHMAISTFTSGWDISPAVVDNEFFLTLLNRDPVSLLLGLNVDMFQSRVIDFDRPDLIAINNGQRSGKQFTINIPEELQNVILFVPRPRDFKYLNIDVSLAFDLGKYIENGLEDDISCHTDAYSICGDKTVLIDGYEDIMDIDDDADICQFKQCPIQCRDGKGGFDRFKNILLNGQLNDIDPNTDCIRALVERFANNNKLFTNIFVDAFTKMITTGYKDKNGKTTLKNIGKDSKSESNEDETPQQQPININTPSSMLEFTIFLPSSSLSLIWIIGALLMFMVFFNICLMCYRNLKKTNHYISVKTIDSENDELENNA